MCAVHRHLEVRIKSALVGAVYNKALTADLHACQESSGRLNNLISVDVDVSLSCCLFTRCN